MFYISILNFEIQFSKILKCRNFIHSHSRSSVSISVQSWKISKARAEEEFKDRCFVVNIRSMIEREQVFSFFFFFFRLTSKIRARIGARQMNATKGIERRYDRGKLVWQQCDLLAGEMIDIVSAFWPFITDWITYDD